MCVIHLKKARKSACSPNAVGSISMPFFRAHMIKPTKTKFQNKKKGSRVCLARVLVPVRPPRPPAVKNAVAEKECKNIKFHAAKTLFKVGIKSMWAIMCSVQVCVRVWGRGSAVKCVDVSLFALVRRSNSRRRNGSIPFISRVCPSKDIELIFLSGREDALAFNRATSRLSGFARFQKQALAIILLHVLVL